LPCRFGGCGASERQKLVVGSDRAESHRPILAADGNARRVVNIGFVQWEDHIDADRKFPADPVIEGLTAIVRRLEQEVVPCQRLSNEPFGVAGSSAATHILAVLPTIIGGMEVGGFAINKIFVEMHFELLAEQGTGIGDERRLRFDASRKNQRRSDSRAGRV